MNIPDAAIEAAAAKLCPADETCTPCHQSARAAIEAAMPAIREAIAQEIESDAGFNEHPWKVGMTRARLIIRTGVFS